MQDDELAALLPAIVAASWARSPALVEPLGGGMNSATARVLLGSSAYVAKWVPSGHLADLRTGLELARDLSARRPARRRAPPHHVRRPERRAVAGGDLALLAWVPGEALIGDTAAEQALLGATLARAHLLGRSDGARHASSRGSTTTTRLSTSSPASGPRSAVVLAEVAALPRSRGGACTPTRRPRPSATTPSTGATGLIDWAGACPGPLLYDVASAVMYLGGLAAAGPFLTAYLDDRPAPPRRARPSAGLAALPRRRPGGLLRRPDRPGRPDRHRGSRREPRRTRPRPADAPGPLLRPAAMARLERLFGRWPAHEEHVAREAQLRENGGYRSVTRRNAYASTRSHQRPTPTTKSNSPRG